MNELEKIAEKRRKWKKRILIGAAAVGMFIATDYYYEPIRDFIVDAVYLVCKADMDKINANYRTK
ncbi:hypothetical protein JW851_01340 [Candidatus Woesearchaeota archaeon]|nr:hypothetical protein [Candidatus Woesearchaeota archaeon]